HIEIMDVNIGITVGAADYRRIDMIEPIISDHLAGNIKDQPSQGIALIGVRLDPPIGPAGIFFNGVGDVNSRFRLPASGSRPDYRRNKLGPVAHRTLEDLLLESICNELTKKMHTICIFASRYKDAWIFKDFCANEIIG